MLEHINSLSNLFIEIKPAVYTIKEIKSQDLVCLKKDFTVAIFMINGNKINDLNSLFKIFAEDLKFPLPCRNLDSFYDWLIDLSECKKEKIIIIFNQYENIKKKDENPFTKITEIFRYYR